ncbi:unnamed protein product [Moneuplotes crassus]|uniref:Uncharacterized protein n=1 Tax=Euplotes crassus TaxID=5936 RepID=A0AAD1Y8Y5_EUPCR|nr:unnamed protein product [Moneuplotes crassus]
MNRTLNISTSDNSVSRGSFSKSPKLMLHFKNKPCLKRRGRTKFSLNIANKRLFSNIKLRQVNMSMKTAKKVNKVKSPKNLKKKLRPRRRVLSVSALSVRNAEEESFDALASVHQKMIFKCKERLQMSRYQNGRFFSPHKLTQKAIIFSYNNKRDDRRPSDFSLNQDKLPQIQCLSP